MTLDKDAAYFAELQMKTGWGRMLARFADWVKPSGGDWVLDAGCGPGLLPSLFAKQGCFAFGLDADAEMFSPLPLCKNAVVGDVRCIPFRRGRFDIITLSNLLFLLEEPARVLSDLVPFLKEHGKIAMLNPSEKLSVASATALADARNLDGLARESLLNWAQRAEDHARWTLADQRQLFSEVGLNLVDTKMVMGEGFVRFSAGRKKRET